MSRMALEHAIIPSSVSTGLRLISMGNSLPSLRKPSSSNPLPTAWDWGLGKKILAMSGVLVPESFRKKHFHGLSEKFLSLIPEKLLDLGVDQDNLTRLIHHNHGVRGALQESSKPGIPIFSGLVFVI